MYINISVAIIMLNLLLISFPLFSEERINLQGISIVGNKELPKMLYIVPWKKSELPEMNTPPIESLVDEALAPVYRESFIREIRYYQIYSKNKKKVNKKQNRNK